jgi:ferredoxin
MFISTPTTLYGRVQQDEKRLAARRRNATLAVDNASDCNAADDCLSSCPTGAAQLRHCGVAVLGKDSAIPCGLRLTLTQLGGSEPVNTKLLEYLGTNRSCIPCGLHLALTMPGIGSDFVNIILTRR